MKNVHRYLTMGSLLLLASAAQAAQTYNFSYKLYDGPVVSGAFSGDASGDLIINLSNVTVSIAGMAFAGPIGVGSYQYLGHGEFQWQGSGGIASFDGTRNNFSFGDGESYFYIIPGGNANGISDAAQALTPTTGYIDYYNGHYSAASWTLSAAVPEPASYAMLCAGLALVGAAVMRGKGRRI